MSDLELALITVVQFIELLDEEAKEKALDKMDLSDEGFNQDFDLVKQAISFQSKTKEI